jgi:hypothetical protein
MPGREAAFIHPGEMILPPEVAERVRQNGGLFGWGPGLPGFAGAYASGDHTGGVGRGPQSYAEAVADMIGDQLGFGDRLGFGLAHAANAMYGAVKSFTNPFSAVAAALTAGAFAESINSWGLQAAGYSKEAADAIAAAVAELSNLDPGAKTAVAGYWGSLENAAARALGDLNDRDAAYGGDYGQPGGSWGEPGNYGGWDSPGGGGGGGSPGGGTGAGGQSADSSQGSDARLLGGPVEAGRQYLVHPPELFIPGADGYVVSRQDTRRLLHGGGRRVQLVVQGPLVTVDARGGVVGEAIPERTAVAVRQALRRLDRVYREY